MELFEELFIDNKRLNSYIKQINGDTTYTDTNYKIGFELSFTPKISAEAADNLRELSTKEKMNMLRDTLTASKKLKRERPVSESDKTEWIEEECTAFRVIVPNINKSSGNIPSFAFWISPNTDRNDKRGSLCLLEDFSFQDDKAISFQGFSTYTLLQSLVYYTREKMISTPLANTIPNEPHSNPFANFDNKPASLVEYHNVKSQAYDFINKTDEIIERWNCKIVKETKIKTLYRVREYGNDATSDWKKTTVFGYPIWIIKD